MHHELVDNTLAKNKKKTLYILNENNFANEDTILILRILINKLKRLLKIQYEIKKHDKNIDEKQYQILNHQFFGKKKIW